MAETIKITGLSELEAKLQKLKTGNPGFEKRLRGVIRKVLGEVRASLQKDAQSGLHMKSDPRKAYKAVRYAVYKRIFGGQVNILQRRKAGQPGKYLKPLKGLPKRGGNRWGRSSRTEALEGYEGADRGFILRFLNSGTDDRFIRTYTDRNGQHHSLGSASTQNIKTRAFEAFRGNISARNWFGPRSQAELKNAAANIQAIIDKIINDEFV